MKSEFQFVKHSHIKLKELNIFEKGICVNFHFKIQQGTKREKLIFCKSDLIFTLDFNTSEIEIVYKFHAQLNRQPLQLVPN